MTIGNEPTALSVLSNCIHGRAITNAPVVCECCGEPGPPKKCSACKSVYYCDVRCQKLHYSSHKKLCARLYEQLIKSTELEKLEAEKAKAEEEEEEAETIKTSASSLSNGSGDNLRAEMDKMDIKANETTNGEKEKTQPTES